MAAVPSDHTVTKAADSLPFDLDEALSFTVHRSSDNFLRASPRPSPNWHPVVLAFPAAEPGGASRCTVCMEGFGGPGGGGRRIPCGHVYHADCIATWLSLGDSCPLCRLKVSSERTTEGN